MKYIGLKKQYDLDAIHFEEPWLLWEVKDNDDWVTMGAEPLWLDAFEYRRKTDLDPQTLKANGLLTSICEGLEEHERVSKIVDDAIKFGLDFETNQLIQVAFKYQESIIDRLAKEVGDGGDWLEWFIYDNDMGKRQFNVTFSNGEKVAVETIQDLIYVIKHD